MNFETSRIGKKVIEFKDVSFAYDDKPILKHFNLLIQAKDPYRNRRGQWCWEVNPS